MKRKIVFLMVAILLGVLMQASEANTVTLIKGGDVGNVLARQNAGVTDIPIPVGFVTTALTGAEYASVNSSNDDWATCGDTGTNTSVGQFNFSLQVASSYVW